MINTIFYFPESLTFDQYLDALNSNTDDGIASRTIVFAKQLGKIYNNGKIYGTTYSDVQNLIELNRYDDEEVRAAIEQLERDLQSESEAIDLQGLRYLALAGRVKTVEDHGYVNESEILTAVAGEIDGSTQKSSIRNKVNNVAKEASAALFTEVSDQNDNITAQSIVNAITSNSTAKANLASSFNSGDNTMWANVLTQADLNNSSSALYAALQSKANDSEVVKKASIIASINSSGESNVSIDADKINLGGDVIAARLTAASARIGGFTIAESKLSNSAVEFNADGSGYLAAGAIKWTNVGALDINADGLLLDVKHPSVWAQWFGNNNPVKGLASFGIVGDYSNLTYKASYNFDTSEFTYIPALGNQDTGLSSDPKEATRSLANTFSSAIFDGSGFGICLLNPAIDTQRLRDEVSQYNTGTGTYEIESGINNIHPYVHLQACLFDPSYHRLAKECTSGLYISSNTDIGGSLIVGGNVYVPNGNLNFGGGHNISLNNLSNQYRLTLNSQNAIDISATDEICLLADNTSCWGDLTAEKIIKNNGTSDQFLKADGSVATLKTINGNSLEGTGDIVISGGGSGNYLPLTGGTMTGPVRGSGNIITRTDGHQILSANDYTITLGRGNCDLGLATYLYGQQVVINTGASATERVYVSETGNVGIGTTQPTQKLEVNGNETVTGDLTVNGNALFDNSLRVAMGGVRFGTEGNVLISRSDDRLLLVNETSSDIIIGDYNNRNRTSIVNDLQGGTTNAVYTPVTANWVIRKSGNAQFRSVTSDSFVKTGGTANEVLMADGTTMTLAQLKAALDAI